VLHAAGDDANMSMALEKVQLVEQTFRMNPIVGIEAGYELAASGSAPTLQGDDNSERLVREQPNPRIAAGSCG
jgi:hypothetical protein